MHSRSSRMDLSSSAGRRESLDVIRSSSAHSRLASATAREYSAVRRLATAFRSSSSSVSRRGFEAAESCWFILASRPINCKGRAEPAEISDACHCDLIAARQPIRPCQKALTVPIGAESVMAGRCAEKKPSHKPGFSFAGSVTTENFTSLTKVYSPLNQIGFRFGQDRRSGADFSLPGPRAD